MTVPASSNWRNGKMRDRQIIAITIKTNAEPSIPLDIKPKILAITKSKLRTQARVVADSLFRNK
jgi:hypothetical protein